MRRVWCCGAVLAISSTAQLRADGGRLVAQGMLHGRPVAVYVSPATPRVGTVTIQVSGEAIRERLPTASVIGLHETIALGFGVIDGDPIGVEAAVSVSSAGIIELRIDGLDPSAVPISVSSAAPRTWKWMPWLLPSVLVAAMASVRPKRRSH